MLSEAFQPPGPASLPADMTEGRVTLLYKGKGVDRAQSASYRAITLLTTDYKLAARVIASRLGPLLKHVVDSTQTGFLPQRWIGDNILAHLETVDFHQHSQQPGVILFLDFETSTDWTGPGRSDTWQQWGLERAHSDGSASCMQAPQLG